MLSVVLPTYEEADNVVPVLRALRAALPGPDDEIIVVDDDSPDGTWRLAEREAAAGAPVRVLRRVGRRGLAGALAEGFRACRGELVGWMDCDLSTPPALFPALAAKVREGFDIALASRYVPGGADGRDAQPLRRALSRAICALGRGLLAPGVRDLTSGFAVARRELLEELPPRGSHGEYFVELVVRARRRGRRLAEVPYRMAPRRGGSSKTDAALLRHGARYLMTVARLAVER